MTRNKFLLSALLVVGLFCGIVTSDAQTPSLNAPLLKSNGRIFAIGEPRVIGIIKDARSFCWRFDGGALAFIGRVPTATVKEERTALREGEKMDTGERQAVFVYDVASGRLRSAIRLNYERDKEVLYEIEWAGEEICAYSSISSTSQAKARYLLYSYSPSADKTTFLTELPASPSFRASPTGAPFLIETHQVTDGEQYSIIFEGKIIPLPRSRVGFTAHSSAWSVDGTTYFCQYEAQEGDETRDRMIYVKAGVLKIEQVNRKLFNEMFQFQSRTMRCLFTVLKNTLEAPEQYYLVNRPPYWLDEVKPAVKVPLPPDEATSFLLDEYALGPSKEREPSLAPGYSGVAYTTHKTLFYRPLAEIKSSKHPQLLLRLERAEVKRIAEAINTAHFNYAMAQLRNPMLDELTAEGSRASLAPDITDKEVIRRFRWICKNDIFGEIRSKHFQFIVHSNYMIDEKPLSQ